MIKRGQSWWGWWQKKYFPLPEHAEVNLGGFETTIVAAVDQTVYGANILAPTRSFQAFGGGQVKALAFPARSLSAEGTQDIYGRANFGGFDTEIEAHGFNGATAEAELFGPTRAFEAWGGGEASLGGVTRAFSAYGGAVVQTLSISTSIDAFGYTGTSGRGLIKSPTRSLTARSGAYTSLGGFTTTFGSTTSTGVVGSVDLSGFNTGIVASGVLGSVGRVSISLSTPQPLWGTVSLSGFTTQIIAGNTLVANPSVAYAMNISSAETTRYTNFDFHYIVRWNGDYYGVKPDGLYLLEGSDDNGTVINSTFKTSMMDFDTALHKRVPYMYIDTEFDTTVTPYAEEASTGTFTAAHNGRRVRLSRGPRGRQWEFEVSNVNGNDMKVGSLEAYAQVLTRKV